AHTGEPGYRAVAVGKARDGANRCVLGGVSAHQARAYLADLAALRNTGLRAPLPMAVKSSAAYAQARRRMTPANARARAVKEWETDRFAPEADEREHQLIFGRRLTFDEFAAALP